MPALVLPPLDNFKTSAALSSNLWSMDPSTIDYLIVHPASLGVLVESFTPPFQAVPVRTDNASMLPGYVVAVGKGVATGVGTNTPEYTAGPFLGLFFIP